MAAEEPSQLEQLFERLNSSVKNQQHKKALKAADEILAIAPADEDALHCKAVALLQLSEWDKALQILSKHDRVAQSMPFEKAYCMYRLGRLDQALAVVQSISDADKTPARLQLEAQLQYRLGATRECIQLYDVLFQQHKVESLELKTNVCAAYVAAQLAHELPALMSAMKVSSKSSFELAFNKACGLVETGDYASAELELRLAIKQGREVLFEDDLSEDEVDEELAPLTAQLALVLSKLGRCAEAAELYNKLLRGHSELEDEVTRIIANNNVTMDQSINRLDGSASNKKFVANATKKADSLVERGVGTKFIQSLDTRLSAGQKLAFHLNRGLLYLVGGKLDMAHELSAALAAQHPGFARVTLLQAAVLSAENKILDADRLLDNFCSAHPQQALEPTLMRVQLALDAGNTQAAATLLSSIQNDRVALSGAVVVSQAALYEQLGDTSSAEALLDTALQKWKAQKGDVAASAVGWCLQQLIVLKLKLGKTTEALQLYQQQSAASGVSSQSAAMAAAVARLARVLAVANVESASALDQDIKARPTATGIDVGALEQSVGGIKRKEPEAGRKREADVMEVDEQPTKKTKRKRKPRYPKGYDASLPNGGLPPPDPERWLPKWQRSDYKKKRGRKHKDAVKGSQGAGKVDDKLDRTAAEASKPSTSATNAKPSLPARKGKGKK